MSTKQKIHISIAFGDAILPIIECEDGHQRVPLKPIVEQIGAQWEGQRKKIQPDSYLGRRLGAQITISSYGELSQKQGNPAHLCIRIDRVTAYLNSLNPEMIRAKGNDSTADWLEAKHQEWDDALHEYETNGLAINKNYFSNQESKEKAYLRMVSVIRQKARTENLNDRKLMAGMLKNMSEIHGLEYQLDLLDESGDQNAA